MKSPKVWLDLDSQLDLLKDRKLRITDDTKAKAYLARIGYYRLSGYFYPLREVSGEVILLDNGKKPQKVKVEKCIFDSFKPDACFQDAIDLYVFDKQLRLLVTDALERIEIALRTDIAHTLGELDPFAYLRTEYLHPSFYQTLDSQKGISKHHEWISKHATLIMRSKEEFIRHHKTKYGLPIPIWVACEVWDFGTMSALFAGMREQEQDKISSKYGIHNGRLFATWLRSLNYLRNICAHHSRLWNRNIIDQPKLPSKGDLPWLSLFHDEACKSRCFLLICICKHLLEIINPSSSWKDRMYAHLLEFPQLEHLGLSIQGMGAPHDWESLWKENSPAEPAVKTD
ncbi:Abi family protein [Neisseria sp. S1]|uniref:Abi family protein n=1 Tax=Neisseria sp. S1 TaxID=3318354 RepID=UPI003A8B499A